MGKQGNILGRWRGSLIAIAVASVLVVSPLLVVAAASGRADARRASPSRARVTHVAFLAPIASFLVQELASNVFSAGFGWVLGQYGEKENPSVDFDAKLAPIREKLQTIEDRLSAIEASTNQLRAELAQVNFNHLAAGANDIIGQINYGVDRLNTIAYWPTNLSQADKKLTAEDLKKYIRDNLLDKQHVLDLKIDPKVGEGLIASAYKVEKSHAGRFWVRRNWIRVRDVLDYYQDEEARLLLLRVEYWHSAGYSGDFIKHEIGAFEQTLRNQRLVLKTRPLPNEIVDTKSDKNWDLNYLFTPMTIGNATKIKISVYRQGWYLPFRAEITEDLIKGWQGKNWAEWLNNQIGGQLTVPCCFQGAWTGEYHVGTSFGTGQLAVLGNGKVIAVQDPGRLLGVLLIRNRAPTTHYW